VAVGTPTLLAALVLGFFGNLFSSLTHYGSGPAPILFASGYVELPTWWTMGAIASVINIVIWFGIGGLWWKIMVCGKMRTFGQKDLLRREIGEAEAEPHNALCGCPLAAPFRESQ
jgi:hypothetical protein